jgi:hypothetical protein
MISADESRVCYTATLTGALLIHNSIIFIESKLKN